MTKVRRQPQRLETILGVGIHQLRVTGQKPQDIVDLACCRGFEDRQCDGLICQEGGDLWLPVIGRDQDRAATFLPNVNQAWVDNELTLHLVPISLLDRVEETKAHTCLPEHLRKVEHISHEMTVFPSL